MSDTMNGNDRLVFKDTPAAPPQEREKWKLLIVDDEEDVHKVTKLVLSGFSFSGKKLQMLSAYSRAEAEKLLAEHEDIAIILLDVVMEEDDAGLRLVRHIREELGNKWVRIILRTGQPGQAPEARVVIQYDINDYKSKTELTSEKLATTIISSLRAYRDIMTINRSRKGLEKIIDASATIFEMQSMKNFVGGVLLQLVSLLHLEKDALYCHASGLTATAAKGDLKIMAATGKYGADAVNQRLRDVVEDRTFEMIHGAFTQKRTVWDSNRYAAYFCSKNGTENIVYLERSEDMNEWEKDLIDIFCSNIAIAYENIYLNQELEESQKEIIITLGEIAENRSKETQNHVRRVGEYCKFIALAYGMDENEAEIVSIASALHDIGKLAVPDAILCKPGKLSSDEFAAIKQHSMTGAEMLRFSQRNILKPAALIAFQHHERFNGTGYPMGLKGEEIHIYSRITTVADVFDALTTDRVYRKALPLEDVVKYFEDERGKQFDPALVDILLDNMNEIAKIMNETRD